MSLMTHRLVSYVTQHDLTGEGLRAKTGPLATDGTWDLHLNCNQSAADLVRRKSGKSVVCQISAIFLAD